MNILYKPNPLIEGILETDKLIDIEMFNTILCNLQKQSKSSFHVSVVPLEKFKEIISDTSMNTQKSIFFYLTNTFQKKIIRWRDRELWKSVNLITEVTFNESTKEFSFYIHDDLIQLVLYYKELNQTKEETEKKIGITPLNLDLMSKSRSFYSQRLYEMLRQWSGVGKKSFTVEEIKEKLLIKNNYSVYYDFKKRILIPSVNRIKKNLNMDISFDEVKKGRKIHEIVFYINDLEPRNYNFNLSRVDSNGERKLSNEIGLDYALNNKSILEPVKSKGKSLLADRTLKELIKKYGEDEVNISYKILKEKNNIEKIKAPKKYIIGILDNRKVNKEQLLNKINNKSSSFNNFTQREYDYEKLERQLLGWASDEEYDD